MSLTPPAITGAIVAVGAAIFPGSQNLPKIALAVGNSVPSWIPNPIAVLAQGATVGVAGGGTVSGKMFVIPAGQVPGALAAAGLVGLTAPLLGTAVEQGFAASFNASAQYTGVSIGVSAGVDVSKVINSQGALLIPILLANLLAVGITGVTAPQLATGLGLGISALVLTGIGVGGVIPVAPAPAPGVGTSLSIVF